MNATIEATEETLYHAKLALSTKLGHRYAERYPFFATPDQAITRLHVNGPLALVPEYRAAFSEAFIAARAEVTR